MGLVNDRVAVVTGASRGAGKGIAIALGATGATVYVTGRTQQVEDGSFFGSIHDAAAAVTEAGGKGIAVICDHSDDEQVKALFDQVKEEQGRIDILVNNVTNLPENVAGGKPYWERGLDALSLLDVGMRSHYVASYYAAPMMLEQGEGLIVMTSSPGGSCYMHGPAYGAGKAAKDKMAHDMGHEFKEAGTKVAVVSLWMGILATEMMDAMMANNPDADMSGMMAMFETPGYTGKIIDALAKDENLMDKSAKVHYVSELGVEYGIKDDNDIQPVSHRDQLAAPTEFAHGVVG